VDLDERTRRLLTAGVELVQPWPLLDDTVTPVDVAWSASSCGRESGRVDRAFDDTDPDRIDRGNAAWLELARQFGLFDREGRFLLSVSTGTDDVISRWFQARLKSDWDLIGAGGAECVLGFGWGVPGFVMHSIDGAALVAASSYESGFSVFAVPHPNRSSTLRRSAEQWLAQRDWPRERRASAERWLARSREP